jgi:hypothetical protein
MMVALPQTTRFGAVKVSLYTLRRLWRDLDAELQEQRKIEQHNADIHLKSGEKDEGLDAAFRVACIVTRSDNHSDVLYHEDELVQPPEGVTISFVLFTNILAFKEAMNGIEPHHHFEVLLDFTQPRLLDSSVPQSDPTPNPSGLLISGSRAGWRAGIESAVRKHIKERNRVWSWFHGQFIYDLFLVVFGMPFALYACWRLAPLVDGLFGGLSPVVTGGAFVYIGFCSIWLYRLVFSYARWAWPKVELAEQSTPSKTHRRILTWVVVFVATAMVSNLLDVPFVGALAGAIFGR